MLSQTQEKKLETIRRIINCNLSDCGKYIELRIDEHSNVLEDKKRVYAGLCNKCGKRFKIKHSYLAVLGKALGSPKIHVANTAFSGLFSSDE
jgi:hypothetical protein